MPSDGTTVMVQARIPIALHRRLRILCGKDRPYDSIKDAICFALEKELGQYEDDDIQYYRSIALAHFDLMDDKDD